MKILLLSPQPFYQVRGTPIAIDLLLATLSKQTHTIDLVTYHEGESRNYERVKHFRTPALRFLNKVRPGFSIKKLACSTLLFFKAFSLLRKNDYDIVHANEEAVFMAYLFKKLFKVPYVYDMDSSLSGQMIDKLPALTKIFTLAQKFEDIAIRQSMGVLAVCEALCKLARPHNGNVFLLSDVSMLDRLKPSENIESLVDGLPETSINLMYIGNLEAYQGVDLMLESFALASKQYADLRLIVIGGNKETISKYHKLSVELGVGNSIVFAGPKPFDDIGEYMKQAHVLLSPRIQGENTPMKIYNYMASGKAIVATDIYSHTQVLSEANAKLVDVSVDGLADAMLTLAQDEDARSRLGKESSLLAEDHYSVTSFERNVALFFDGLNETLLVDGKSKG